MRGLIIAAVLIAGYLTLVGGLVYWIRSRLFNRARVASKGLEAVGARIGEVRWPSGWRQPAEVDFTLDRTDAKFQVRSYSRDYIVQSIAISAPLWPPMLIRSERGLDRFGKSLGLNREPQLGDAEFDAAAYIDTSAPDALIQQALANPVIREQILQLLRAGYFLETTATGLRASRIRSFYASFEVPELSAVVRALVTLRDAAPKFDATSVSYPTSRVSVPVTASFAVLALGLASFGFIPALHPPMNDGQSMTAFGFGLIAWLVAVVGVGAALRGRPHGAQELILVSLTLLFGIPPLFACLLFVANSGLDHGPVSRHTVQIESMWRRDHEVWFAAWDGSRPRAKVGVPFRVYQTLSVGDTIEIETQPGMLGWTWVSSVRKVDAGQP